MKKIYTILVAVLITASVFLPQQAGAQTPEAMSYQAVIRNASNQLVTNQGIGMQISILQGSATGTAVYVETHNTTTNANGLVTVEIGNGTVVSGDFATIDWANDVYFIQTETDPTTAGGTNYTITGTSQLLSVAYALHAKTAESVTGGITEADPVFIASPTNNITLTDITNLSNLSGTNTGDQDISGIAINTQAIQDTASQIRADIPDVSGFVSTETDPVFIGSEANNITGTDITNLGNLSGINTGDQDISGIAINTQAIQDTASQIRADIPDVSGFISTETDPVFTNWDKDYTDLINTPITITTAQADAITANTAKIGLTPGTTAGEMQYWNGIAWVVVAATVNEGATLQMISGVPTWIGGTPPPTNVTNPTTGKIWMDRNLGATQVATSSTDAAAYGDLYQWGRGTDGHQIRTSATTSSLSNNDDPGHGNFILATNSPYDWRSPKNDNLWQGVSGVNNPCPTGYRLPTEAELDAERASWSSNDAAGAYASPLKLPVAGNRSYSNGSLDNVVSNGYYWSSTIDGTNSRRLDFYSGAAYMASSYRAYGFSVRCIKD